MTGFRSNCHGCGLPITSLSLLVSWLERRLPVHGLGHG
jgi:hypothetical protein